MCIEIIGLRNELASAIVEAEESTIAICAQRTRETDGVIDCLSPKA